MAKQGGISPRDLIGPVQTLLDQRVGEWVSPRWLWEHLQLTVPDLAQQVEQKVARYKDPARNNAVWFVSNTLWYFEKVPGYDVSDIERVPEMKGESIWLVARAEPTRR